MVLSTKARKEEKPPPAIRAELNRLRKEEWVTDRTWQTAHRKRTKTYQKRQQDAQTQLKPVSLTIVQEESEVAILAQEGHSWCESRQ